ncbi:MAG: N-acetyltransferase [Micavibrio sp.]|nr:MAG: N-acetyltransferase [Micavibrio sp.]
MSSEITFNEKESRYEQDHDGHIVYANSHRKEDTVYIDYVYAPPELRGKGAASKFMHGLMALIRTENLKAVPICGFAATWLTRHSEYDDLKS